MDEVIAPSLAAGRVIVSDRFLLSTVVYQGIAGGLPVDDIWRIGQVATGGLLPDLTLVLDVPPESARDRVGAARDRIEDRPPEYQRKVRQGFLEAARGLGGPEESPFHYPAPVTLLDATGELDAVFDRIKSEVERVLALGPRS